MAAVTLAEHFRERYEQGEDVFKLRHELSQIKSRFRTSAGFRFYDEQEMVARHSFGRWEMSRLFEETKAALTGKRATPLDELRECEIAEVHLQFDDMKHPNARRALEMAQRGTRNGGASESAQMARHLQEFADKQPERRQAPGTFVIGSFRLDSN